MPVRYFQLIVFGWPVALFIFVMFIGFSGCSSDKNYRRELPDTVIVCGEKEEKLRLELEHAYEKVGKLTVKLEQCRKGCVTY